MPTTCGFPNCKFRSRYRGQEDNRHFYRIPKRPQVLRQRWLNAIGRTEETVVSQLRICSAHFEGGEKKEGDIPVPDPQLDAPISIKLPPKESKSSIDKRRRPVSCINNQSLLIPPQSPLSSSSSSSASLNMNSKKNGIKRMKYCVGDNTVEYFNHPTFQAQFDSSKSYVSAMLKPNGDPIGLTNMNATSISTIANTPPALSSLLLPPSFRVNSRDSADFGSNHLISTPTDSATTSSTSIFGSHNNTAPSPINSLSALNFGSFPNIFNNMAVQQRTALSNRPLVAVLDARDCSVEMPILKDVATVAFCDASVTSEIHDKVFNEAIAAMSWHNINLGREDLEKFKNLKLIVRIGSDLGNIDVNAASSLGIAVCITGAECIEEVADSTLCSILNLYRKTYFLAKISADLNKSLPLEGIKEAAAGTIRIRNSVLGLIGMGRVGMAVAVRAKAFGFRVVFFDPLIQSGIDKALGIEKAEALDALLKISDCISLHCPLNETTKHIINEETLKQVKRGCFIVNTSSGGLIHDRSLAGALNKGMVRGAALDCHSVEPYDPNTNILSSYQNVINTPNTAWYSDVGCTELRTAAAHEVRRSIQGRFPHDLENCVNKAEIVYFLMNKGNPTIRRNPTVAPYVNPNMPISAQTTPCAMTPTMNPMNEQLAAAALGMKFNPNKIPEQWRPNVNNMNAFRFPNQMLMGINQQQNANMSMIRNNFNQINNLVAANVSQHQMTSMAGSSNLSPIQSYQQPTLPISTAPLINNLLNTKMQVKSLPVSVLPTSNGISQGLVSENSISPNSEPANLINTHESALTEVIKIVESEVTKPETPPSCIVERSKVIDAQEQPKEQMLLSSSPLENIKTKSEAMDTEEPKENTQTSLNNENIEIKEWKEEAMENISDVSPDMNWSEHHNKSSESPGITNDAH